MQPTRPGSAIYDNLGDIFGKTSAVRVQSHEYEFEYEYKRVRVQEHEFDINPMRKSMSIGRRHDCKKFSKLVLLVWQSTNI